MNNNIPALLQLLEGASQPDPDFQQLKEITNKLRADYTLKCFEKLTQKVENLVSDIRGRVEAMCFIRLFLKESMELTSKVAAQSGLPTEVADILAGDCAEFVSEALTHRASEQLSDDVWMKEFYKQTQQPPKLSDDEVVYFESCLEQLKEKLRAKEKESEDIADGVGQMYGKLDPSNPFGLN